MPICLDMIVTRFFLIFFTICICLNADISIAASTNLVIDKAMLMKLPVTNSVMPHEVLQLQKKMTVEITKAAYGHALEIVISSLDKYPNNFLLQTYLAMIIGDYAVQFEVPLKQSMLDKSKSIFNKLMNEVNTQPQGIIFYFKNEYYFRFAQYQQQYENGVARVNAYWGTKEWLAKGFGYYPQGVGGYYSQGVGASNYARELYQQGNKKLAQQYAQKALIAWAQCFSYDNTYYNAYVHYALTLGVLGNKDEMLKALRRGADLIHQDLNYPEFKKVIKFFDEVEKVNSKNIDESRVMTIIKKAESYIKKNGIEKAIIEFKNGSSDIFIGDYNGMFFVSPLHPEMVGKNQLNFKDPSGALVVQEEIAKAKAGGGWIKGRWRKNSQTKTFQCRKIYILPIAGNYFVGSWYHYSSDKRGICVS